MATNSIAKTRVPGAAAFLPVLHTLPSLRSAVAHCKGCDLYLNATQAVFGEGAVTAAHGMRLMMIGEQPGDLEDREGRPFAGPAGKLLDRCLEVAGIDRETVYVTNAVKHFKWEPRGKLRLHKKPLLSEIFACSPWLEAEVEAVKPSLVVCLGATASQALLGRGFRVTRSRGKVQRREGWPTILATAHPASILRAPSEAERDQQTEEFLADLRIARSMLDGEQAGRKLAALEGD